MTAAELIRSARMRAALAQHELADLLGTPRSQIARWEAGEVEPAFATVRRVLQACGFDLPMGLVPYVVDEARDARLRELGRLTPKERLDAALTRGGVEQPGNRLDPYAILAALDERRVDYILIGSLARVLQGADEVPGGLDLVFPKGARDATDRAISSFALPAPPGVRFEGDAWVYWSAGGARIKALETPTGTRGHRDLRRRAERVHLGGGLRPRVASPGDLVRMMEALGRSEHEPQLEAMRRVVELDRGLDR
jgi:transcriptional regulator with XRE-family HTH domain